MKFKKNLHLAKKYDILKVDHLIKNYPSKYPTPKYLLFMREMIEDGWEVRVYVARVSKYIFIIKGDDIFKIRFSNHKPIYNKEVTGDCDFYVGISHTATHTTDEIVAIIKQMELEGKHTVDNVVV